MNCLKSRAGSEGCTVSKVGVPPSSMMGAKFLKMSNGRLGSMAGRVTKVLEMITSVLPSAGARATMSSPMTPDAPGRFSTTTVVPKAGPSSLLTVRARKSSVPPAGNGTMKRICLFANGDGRLGESRHGQKRKQACEQNAFQRHGTSVGSGGPYQPAMGAAVPSTCTRKPERTFGQ